MAAFDGVVLARSRRRGSLGGCYPCTSIRIDVRLGAFQLVLYAPEGCEVGFVEQLTTLHVGVLL